MKLLATNDVPHVWNVTDEGIEGTRPAGTRHEIEIVDGIVTFREVWYFSDNGEVRETRERVIELNAAVHVMVNITDAEVVEFSEIRTMRPVDETFEPTPVIAPGDPATSKCLTCNVSAQQIIEALADDAHSQKLHPVLLKACSYCIVRARELTTPNSA